jgi:hypothetical protein
MFVLCDKGRLFFPTFASLVILTIRRDGNQKPWVAEAQCNFSFSHPLFAGA